MIRIAALNDSSSESGDTSRAEGATKTAVTKEALENAAYQLYNYGLRYDREGQQEKAITAFKDLLDNEFICKVSTDSAAVREDGSLPPNAVLKYSALKNLSKLYSQQGRNDEAIKALLQAIDIDFTDVSVCYRLGLLALKVDHFLLASRAFQKGLEISSSHWPCLDNLLTLLYALNNYEVCLCYLAESLKRDAGYVKALVLRKAILKEQPCLEREFADNFQDCEMAEMLQYTEELEEDEESEVLDVVKEIREKQRARCQPKPRPSVNLNLTDISWAGLGKKIIELYKHIEDMSPELNHLCKVVPNIIVEKPDADHSDITAQTMQTDDKQLDKVDVKDSEPMQIDEPDQAMLLTVPALNFAATDSENSQATPSVITDSDHELPLFIRSASMSNSAYSAGSSSRQAVWDGMEIERELSPPSTMTAVISDADLSQTSNHQDVTLKEVRIVVTDILDEIDGVDAAIKSTLETVIHQIADVNDLVNDMVDRVSESDSQSQPAEVLQVLDDTLPENEVKCDHSSISSVVTDILDEIISSVTKSEITPAPVRRSSSDHMYAKPSVSETAPENQKKKKQSYAQPAATGIGMASRKRRSARVTKQTTKKGEESEKAESRDHVTDLEGIIPSSLLHEATPEHGYSLDMHADRNDDTITPERPTPAVNKEAPEIKEQVFGDEPGDVKSFLLNLEEDMSFIFIMREWVRALCDRRDYSWSTELIKVYIDLYELHRPCFSLPNIFSDDNVEQESLPAAVWMQLKVEVVSGTPDKAADFGSLFEQNFGYWEMIVGCYSKLLGTCHEFSVRFYQMAAQYFQAKSDPDHALGLNRTLLGYLNAIEEATGEKFSVIIRNCKNFLLISAKSVKDDLALLERTQSLEELQSVYDEGNFERVIQLLVLTFETDLKRRYNDSRPTQLKLLLCTLDKKPDAPGAIRLLAEALHESLHYYDKKQAAPWQTIVKSCLEMLTVAISHDTSAQLTASMKVKLAQSCLNVMRLNCKAIEAETKMPIQSIHPWIILSKLIDLQISNEGTNEKQDDFPLFIQLLLRAHSYLADHSLCTYSDGALLQHTIDCMQTYMAKGNCHNTQAADLHIQKSIYCLYGHPNKKIKAKNLKDHGAETIPIKPAAARMLFDYFKPQAVPEFDSYKSSTISAELENLLKRLVVTIPEQYQPDAENIRVVDGYLGKACELEEIDQLKPVENQQMCREIYYLMADYYFKNKEPLKAIKHYKQDLYYTPDRLDSWAGMALAKSSKLESRLGFMERQCYDGAFQKLAVSTMQSFTRALQLHHDNVKIWIEYACSTYQLHSFASRVIKSKKSDLSDTELDTFTQLRSEMLERSKCCYIEASTCQSEEEFEEEWLHHYMLGKISEKSGEGPEKFLYHYQKASECLDDEGAQYPAKISYMYTAPYLAVEVLEMYYRIHTSILKCVQRTTSKDNYKLYSEVIRKMQTSSFVTATPSTPQQPTTKRTKRPTTASESSSERPQTKRRKSESEIIVKSPKLMNVTTRRQGKLRLDAEIVHEVIEDLLISVQDIVPGAPKSQTPETEEPELTAIRELVFDMVSLTSAGGDHEGKTTDSSTNIVKSPMKKSQSFSGGETLMLTAIRTPSQTQISEIDKSEFISAQSETEYKSAEEISVADLDSAGRRCDDIVVKQEAEKPTEVIQTDASGLLTSSAVPEELQHISETPSSDRKETAVLSPGDVKPIDDGKIEQMETTPPSTPSITLPASPTSICKQNDSADPESAPVPVVDTSSCPAVEQQQSSDGSEKSDDSKDILTRDELTESCISALKLCVKRFPLHYKSYYRLARVFLHDRKLKDLDKVQDLLLGNTGKKKDDKYVLQGLFQDRKHNNFFNGVWRIPVEEIERAGSFGAHLFKTIYLLLQYLHEKRDYHLLYQLHTQLQRTPDQEKKFLKDADRILLSSKAMEFAIHSLYKVIGADSSSSDDGYKYAAYLHQAYKWFTYCNKNNICIPNGQVLIIKAYKTYKKVVDPNAVLESNIQISEAKDFCYQKFSARGKDKSKASAENKTVTSTTTNNSDTKTLISTTENSSKTTTVVTPSTSGSGVVSTPSKITTTLVGLAPSSTQSQPKKLEGQLPPVRGSFQSFDVEKGKKARVFVTVTRPTTEKAISSDKQTPLKQSEDTEVSTVPNPLLPIAATSWLNKAKDGGAKALASMFDKSKTSQ